MRVSTETSAPIAAAETRGRMDATSALTIVFFLVFVIPAPEAIGPLGGAGTPAMVMCVILAGLWCLASLRSIPERRSRVLPLRGAFLFLLVSSMASWVIASSRRVTHEEVKAADRGLLVMLGMIGFALFTAELIENRERLDVAIDRLILGGVFLACVGIAQFNVHFDVVRLLHVPGLKIVIPAAGNGVWGFVSVGSRSGFSRVGGTTMHPVEFGYVLALLFPIALHRAFFPPAGRRKLFSVAPPVLIGIAITMSISRTAVLAVIIAGVIMIPSWPSRRRWNTLFAVPFFLVVMRVVYPGLIGTLYSLFSSAGTDVSVKERTARYSIASKFIHQAPIFGRGIKTLLPPMIFDNQWLETTIETGFVGLVALIGVFVTAIVLLRLARHAAATDPRTRDLAQCLTASIVAGLITFGTWDALSFPVATIVTFTLFGFAGALWRVMGRPSAPSIARTRAAEAELRQLVREDEVRAQTDDLGIDELTRS